MKKQNGWTLTELLFALCAVASLALMAGGIYVAIHFIRKFW